MAHLSWLWRRGTDGPLTSSLSETIWSNIQHAQNDSNPVGVQRPLRGTFASSVVKAQSTLFNIPSTDVVATKRVYVEFDFVSHLEAHQKGGFQSYIPRVIVGIAKNLEAGANVAFLDTMSRFSR